MTTERSPSEPGAAKAPAPPPATSQAALVVLSKRADFLAAARARRQAAPAFLLQARQRAGDMSPAETRVGFTCSKKVGNAVARNRAKRRLREIARLELPLHGKPGWDYVLIGRKEATATRDFAALRADLVSALARIHAPRKPSGKPSRTKDPRA